MKTKLSVLLWIKAAFRALTSGGPQAIRVESIARDLNVSKGSFYWHFENVAALKTAMLAHWKMIATEAVIAQVEGQECSAAEKLRQIVDTATSGANSAYGGVFAEAAIRDWARYDNAAAEMANYVDIQRLAYLKKLFEQNGSDKSDSQTHANVLYAGLIGLEILSYRELSGIKNELHFLLEMLLQDT